MTTPAGGGERRCAAGRGPARPARPDCGRSWRIAALLLVVGCCARAEEPAASPWREDTAAALRDASEGGRRALVRVVEGDIAPAPAALETPEMRTLLAEIVRVRVDAGKEPAPAWGTPPAWILLDEQGKPIARVAGEPSDPAAALADGLDRAGSEAAASGDWTAAWAAWGALFELLPASAAAERARGALALREQEGSARARIEAERRAWEGSQLLAKAKRASARGDAGESRALLDRVRSEFSGTPAAAEAARRLAPPASADAILVLEGKILYTDKMCNTCHHVNRKRGVLNGPNLAAIGARIVARTGGEDAASRWLHDHLRNPERFPGPERDQFPTTRMPAVPMSDPERERLVAYLLSLR